MTCTEFQNVLPYIIDSDLTPEERAHLDSCRACSDVVTDLRHIAQSAKFLISAEEPPARVWHTVRRRLERQEDGCPSYETPTFVSTPTVSSVK
jgi:hypothetical protein